MPSSLFGFNVFVDVLFIIDIAINFRTAFVRSPRIGWAHSLTPARLILAPLSHRRELCPTTPLGVWLQLTREEWLRGVSAGMHCQLPVHRVLCSTSKRC